MTITAKLLRVYQVDAQYRGLQSRLKAAEKFLGEQDKQLGQLGGKNTTLQQQLKELTAAAKNAEGEMARLDARSNALREQMNAAKTNKEYKAFLTELNTLKAERDRFETTALEQMAKADEVKKQLGELENQLKERQQVKGVAAQDRDQKAEEIRGRLAELKAQRDAVVAEVPSDVMSMFQRLLDTRGDEAMAPVQELDRRRYEFTCGSCMMSLPMDTISGLLSSGKLTRCASCQCVLYVEQELAEALQAKLAKK